MDYKNYQIQCIPGFRDFCRLRLHVTLNAFGKHEIECMKFSQMYFGSSIKFPKSGYDEIEDVYQIKHHMYSLQYR